MCEYIFRKDWIFYSYSALSAMGKYLVESLLLQIVEKRYDDNNNATYIMIKLKLFHARKDISKLS